MVTNFDLRLLPSAALAAIGILSQGKNDIPLIYIKCVSLHSTSSIYHKLNATFSALSALSVLAVAFISGNRNETEGI